MGSDAHRSERAWRPGGGVSPDFRVDQRARSRELERAQHVAPEDLERAVNITHVHSEEDTHGEIEGLREELAVELVVSFHAEPGDDVELINQWRQHAEIGDIELTIGVHEHDEIAGGGLKPSRQRPAISLVLFSGEWSDAFVLGGELVDDRRVLSRLPSSITTSKSSTKAGSTSMRVQRPVDVGFLVVRREDDGEAAPEYVLLVKPMICERNRTAV